jgi:hypothetical protein
VGFMDAVLELSRRAFHERRSRFRGALIQPGEEAYAETRPIWNGPSTDFRH